MLTHPKIGQRVELRYAAAKRPAHAYRNQAGELVPYHAARGVVLVASSGGRGPRNHLVRLDDGTEAIVPAGNLFPLAAG